MSEKFGSYIIKQELGAGGYGCAFLAIKEGEELKEGKKRYYVLKFPLEQIGDDDKLDFNNEIDTLIKLSKLSDNEYTPKIYDFKKFNLEDEDGENEIKVLDDEEDNETPYYVIDYFSKGILEYYIENNPFEEKTAKVIFKNIALGVQFLHNHNICHLDLKPNNIFLNKTFKPIILDFGFATKYKDENGNSLILKGNMGAQGYKCPEMWEKARFYGDKADIFSLGVILFKLVTGEDAFEEAKSSDELYKLIIDNNYSTYWEKFGLTDFSEDFKELYKMMIHYDAKERWTIDKVLESDWLKEIDNLSEDEEKKIKKELECIY